MSAPWFSGRQCTGVARVASQANKAPAAWAIVAQAAMSVTVSSGLPGDSIQTSFVPGTTARATAAVSVVSTAVTRMPWAVSSLLNSRQVPP